MFIYGNRFNEDIPALRDLIAGKTAQTKYAQAAN
jgi:hypothetical protein